MKLNEVAVDSRREEEGDWVESPRFPGVHAKVRSLHNAEYRRALQRENGKLRRKYGDQPVPPEVQEKLSARMVVDYILLDIQGLEDEQDQPITYSREFGLEIMTDPAYRRLADFIAWAASVVGEQEAEGLDDDAKNSGTASTGKQAGGGTSKR